MPLRIPLVPSDVNVLFYDVPDALLQLALRYAVPQWVTVLPPHVKVLFFLPSFS